MSVTPFAAHENANTKQKDYNGNALEWEKPHREGGSRPLLLPHGFLRADVSTEVEKAENHCSKGEECQPPFQGSLSGEGCGHPSEQDEGRDQEKCCNWLGDGGIKGFSHGFPDRAPSDPRMSKNPKADV